MRQLACLSVFLLAACGSSTPNASSPDPASSAADANTKKSSDTAKPDEAAGEEKAEEDSAKIPSECAEGNKDPCLMPKGFVRRLCGGAYPELALYFFQKDSPWKRAYVSIKQLDPFNGLNGPNSDEKLVFEEELLVLQMRKADLGGMQVSGAGASYDVMRWDGTCATLSAEEVRLQGPSKPKHATIPWRSLEDATQNALLKDEALAKVASERRKECKGATMGTVSAKCEKADKMLNDLVVEAVRNGVSIPLPEKKPK